jgi:formamidopyrimidine-DNA glycosylase
MPELPEVETVRKTLEPIVVGRTIVGLEVGTFAGVLGSVTVQHAAAAIFGRRLTGIRRRGKFLLIDLDDESGIEVHLRMTGQLEVAERGAPPLRFQHLALLLDNGLELRFADQRKFGRVIIHDGDPALALKTKLGPEPLENAFTSTYLRSVLRGRTAAIKSLLLDQRIIAGIGNIYADEALFLARIHPQRPGGTLADDEVDGLVDAIIDVLRTAIDHRGTTFSSYRDGTGQVGENQHRLAVYGRGRRGEPCIRCGNPLAYLVIGQRTSHFCPECQPLQLKTS